MTTAIDSSVEGRTIVVTGSSSGIGAALSGLLAERGAHVIGLDRRVSSEFVGKDFVEVDLGSSDSVSLAVHQLPAAIHGIANVAGVSAGIGDPMAVMNINFLGTRELTESLLDHMEPGGTIVNTSSLAAEHHREHVQLSAQILATSDRAEGLRWCARHREELGGGYCLSKEALIAYTQARAWDWGPRRIRVNSVGPGITQTPMLEMSMRSVGSAFLDAFPQPLGRSASAAEQAKVIAFLLGQDSSFVNGQNIWVDGGYMAGRESGRCDSVIQFR